MYLAPMLKRPCRLFDRSHSYVTEADPDQSGANGIVAPGSLYRAPLGSTNSHSGLWPPKRSEEHTSELQPLLRISYADLFLLQQQKQTTTSPTLPTHEPS